MPDIHNQDASNADAAVTLPLRTTRTLRWRVIPGTFLAIFSVIGVIGSAMQFFTVAYYNCKYGWIEFDPENRLQSELAITPLHVLVWLFASCGFVVAGVAAYSWFHARWRFAWIGTGVFFALMFTAKWLESL